MKENEKNYTVYMHVFPHGKKYVGITCRRVKSRWKGGYGYVHNRHMMSAINKYGWENVEHKILFEHLTKEQAERIEIDLIAKYDLTNRENGYNIELGGKGANRITEETRQILREKCGGKNNARYGVKVSEETRKKIGKAHLGTKLTKEHIEKIKSGEGRRIYRYTLDGEFIDEWVSGREAGRIFHCNPYMCCNGKNKTAGGYIWKWKDQVELTNK